MFIKTKGPFIFYGVGGTGGIRWVVPVKYNDPLATLEIFCLAPPCSPKYLRRPPQKKRKQEKVIR